MCDLRLRLNQFEVDIWPQRMATKIPRLCCTNDWNFLHMLPRVLDLVRCDRRRWRGGLQNVAPKGPLEVSDLICTCNSGQLESSMNQRANVANEPISQCVNESMCQLSLPCKPQAASLWDIIWSNNNNMFWMFEYVWLTAALIPWCFVAPPRLCFVDSRRPQNAQLLPGLNTALRRHRHSSLTVIHNLILHLQVGKSNIKYRLMLQIYIYIYTVNLFIHICDVWILSTANKYK